jgi:hypothetical protein
VRRGVYGYAVADVHHDDLVDMPRPREQFVDRMRWVGSQWMYGCPSHMDLYAAEFLSKRRRWRTLLELVVRYPNGRWNNISISPCMR